MDIYERSQRLTERVERLEAQIDIHLKALERGYVIEYRGENPRVLGNTNKTTQE